VVQWAPGTEGTPSGFRVLHVPEETAAAGAGIARGDVLVAVDGQPLAWPEARRFLDPKWSSRQLPILTVRSDDRVRLTTLPETEEE
jgi:S1-C subfamily serine protease